MNTEHVAEELVALYRSAENNGGSVDFEALDMIVALACAALGAERVARIHATVDAQQEPTA